MLCSHLIRAAMIQSIESKMEADVEEVIDRKRLHAGKHIPLLQRAREPSVEERMQRRAARPQVNLATV